LTRWVVTHGGTNLNGVIPIRAIPYIRSPRVGAISSPVTPSGAIPFPLSPRAERQRSRGVSFPSGLSLKKNFWTGFTGWNRIKILKINQTLKSFNHPENPVNPV